MSAPSLGGQATVHLTPLERRQYVRWWLTKSGLSRAEVVAIATGMAFDSKASSNAYHTAVSAGDRYS
jgi:hypothetical protein